MIIPARIYIAGIVALALATAGMYAQREKARSALSDYRREVADATRKDEALARDKETAMRGEAEQMRTALEKVTQHAQVTQARLVADIRSGAQRLSIAANCRPAAGQAATDSGSTPGAADGARAELDPAAAEDLVAIASDGDSAIRERNACIQQYNAVLETLN